MGEKIDQEEREEAGSAKNDACLSFWPNKDSIQSYNCLRHRHRHLCVIN